MRRPLLRLATLAVVGLLTMLAGASASSVSAQTTLVAGDLPPTGGIGLLTVTQASTASDVATELEARGCEVGSLAITEGGRWRIFSPDAPDFVNAGFPNLAASQVFLVQCEEGGVTTQDNVVTGTVSYLQRIALPPQAVVTVSLEDVSLQDAPSVTLAEQTITADGAQVPFSFELVYDQADIQETNTYVVRAEITVDDELWFTTDTSHPVITGDQPRNVDLVLVQVAGTDPGDDPLTQVIGRGWEWIATTLEDGSTIEPNVRGDSTILLNPDGSLYIDTDCNSWFGDYTLEDTSVTLTPQGGTLMACLGTSMEDAFIDGLERVESYSIVQNGTTLVLGFPDGEGNMSFFSGE